MNTRMQKYYMRTLLLLLLPVILASCRKELCYNHFRAMEVTTLWEHEWERDYGRNHQSTWDTELHGMAYDEMRPGVPEWLVLMSYAKDGTTRESFLQSHGGEVIVDQEPAEKFLIYNGDTEYIILSDMASLTGARASATGRSRSSLKMAAINHPNSRTTAPPDVLYAANVYNIPSVEMHEKKTLPVKMQPLVYTYVVRYEFERGQEYVTLARGALGGMAESVYLRDGSTSDRTSVILFDCDVTSYGCMAQVRSFGVPGFPDKYYGKDMQTYSETSEPYTLNLEVLLVNGNTLEFDFDVTDQIVNQPRGGVITVSGIEVDRASASTPSGFTPEVTDWGEHVDIDLPVGPSK